MEGVCVTKIPYVFLMQASNILGSTEKGLTGGEITQLFSAYSFDFHNENVPHIQAPLNAPNKRTAILENLVAFPAEQQYEIIRELCSHSKLADNIDAQNLKTQLMVRYGNKLGKSSVLEPNQAEHIKPFSTDYLVNNGGDINSMYYHVIIELDESYCENISDQTEIKPDITDLRVVADKYTEPYQTGSPILINGRTIPIEHIKRLRIFESDISSKILEQNEANERRREEASSSIIFITPYCDDLKSAISKQKDITEDLITYAKGTKVPKKEIVNLASSVKPSKVFLVHGHDDALVYEVTSFLHSQSIIPIILREQHDPGLTIIAKLERYTEDPSVGFGIVLYTADDMGKAIGEEEYKYRARQNVVFEHGLLIGLYTRSKVVCLVKTEGKIEMPGDVSGVVYTEHSNKDWRLSVAHMLTGAGYEIDYSKIN